MKRRKTVNRYRIGENGQITNTSPRKLSNTTRNLLDFMMFAQMMADMEDIAVEDGVESTTTIEEETTTEATDDVVE